MSITRTVVRFSSVCAAVALVTVAALQPAPVADAAASRRFAPAGKTADDPASRIAGLTALVSSREAARTEAVLRRDVVANRLADTHRAENAALARADLLGRAAVTAESSYRKARAQVGALAAAYYRDAGNPRAIVRLLESRSAAEFGYRQKIVSTVGDRQTRIVKRALHTRDAARRAARNAGNETRRLHSLVASLQAEIPRRDARVDELQTGLSRARYWLARWESIAGGVNTPIMSHSVLGPSELAEWFTATRRRGARITVSMSELARAFIEEGQGAQVRGDIAFAQSILETASFYFPDGGQLTPVDNNFAGINACDSCPTGSAFPDARTGVRAQMQLLRVYADANFTLASLNPPAVDPRIEHHFLKGRVPTWNGLTHTWATADRYGDRILEIYAQILGWLADRANI